MRTIREQRSFVEQNHKEKGNHDIQQLTKQWVKHKGIGVNEINKIMS